MYKRYLGTCAVIAMVSLALLHLPAFASSVEVMNPELRIGTIVAGEREGVFVGEQLIIEVRAENLLNEDKDYAIIVEIRDSDGITESLNWQTGSVDAEDTAYAGMTWTPQRAGDYQVRTFVLSGIDNPEPYSTVIQSEVTVVRL